MNRGAWIITTTLVTCSGGGVRKEFTTPRIRTAFREWLPLLSKLRQLRLRLTTNIRGKYSLILQSAKKVRSSPKIKLFLRVHVMKRHHRKLWLYFIWLPFKPESSGRGCQERHGKVPCKVCSMFFYLVRKI